MIRRHHVIVIGGGHAGVEAAWAAANILASHGAWNGDVSTPAVALVTIDPSKIGVMSCNPAIGGLAKGQLVREVDALGGIMGLATDATGIQFKVLNTSKGPAVYGPRAQCDKHAYAEAVRLLLASRPEIGVIAGAVESLIVENGFVRGVAVKLSAAGLLGGVDEVVPLRADAVVLTTGTFMRGLMHTGETRTEGGRHGEAAAVGISGALAALGFELGRLKTGTPPRLKRSTIDWDALPVHTCDAAPSAFSDLTGRDAEVSDAVPIDPDAVLGPPAYSSPGVFDPAGAAAVRGSLHDWAGRGFAIPAFPMIPQADCRATSTDQRTHEIIRANLHRAPMFTGQIESAGPRYCPSIEDKVVRFADRASHGVFLEPETLRDDWVYCNGISTSLPADVQDQIVRAMPGCGRAEIYRYGYAVEYDMVRPHQIEATGQTKPVRGLFLAGQINGTSGYEEAAAQGLVAGVNAARLALGLGDWTLSRDRAYIGVLMDDLVTKTPVEPYRMFTSRAEHRLLLRADNAAERLTPEAIGLGLLGATTDHGLGARRHAAFERRRTLLRDLGAAIDAARYEGSPLAILPRRPDFGEADLRRAIDAVRPGAMAGIPSREADALIRTLHADRLYAPFIERQRAEIERQRESEHRRLPDMLDDAMLAPMRPEARQALRRFRPRTFGQAGRLEGITPADLTLLAVITARAAR